MGYSFFRYQRIKEGKFFVLIAGDLIQVDEFFSNKSTERLPYSKAKTKVITKYTRFLLK